MKNLRCIKLLFNDGDSESYISTYKDTYGTHIKVERKRNVLATYRKG